MFPLGGASAQQQPSSIFGAPSTSTSTFGQPASTSSQSFGFSATSSSAPSLYNPYTNPSGTTLPMLGGGLFGTVPPQNQQGASAFGQNPNQAANNQQGGGLFGQPSNTNQQQGGGLFGQPSNTNQQQGGPIFPLGGSTNQQQQGGGNLNWGGNTSQPQQQQKSTAIFPLAGGNQQQQQGNSIFGQPQNQQQQQEQQQQQPQQQTGNPLGQSRIWSEQDGQLRKLPPVLPSSIDRTSTNLALTQVKGP